MTAPTNENAKNGAITYIKGLSIISVICAHCNSIEGGGYFVRFSSLLLQNWGTIGVICFFILSGALFDAEKGTGKEFLGKKAKSLCVPWLISGLAVFFYVYLRKPPITIKNMLNYMIGNGSYLYYMSMLFICYLIFRFLPFMRTIPALIICIILTIISTMFFYSPFNRSPYMNIFNWVGYFALGAIIRKYQTKVDAILKSLIKWRFVVYLLYIAVLVFQLWRGEGGWYFKGINVPFCWIGAVALIVMGIKIEQFEKTPIKSIIGILGKNTLFIYLWHMPIAGIVARLMSYSYLSYLMLVRPLIIVAIMMFASWLIKLILQKIKGEQLGFIVGIKL